MATKRLSNFDMNKNQILNMLLQMIAGDHGTPVEGLIWYDSTAHVIKFRDNTTIQTLAAGGGVLASVWDANSLVKADADNTPVVLTLGTDALVGRITGVNGGVISSLTAANIKTFLNHTDEELQDLIGAMFSGGTYTGITPTYDDPNARFNLVVGALNTLPAPAGSLSMNSQLITNLLTPSTGTDAANKAYVDAAAVGIDWKASVRAATTANGTLASAFANTSVVDGVTLATGNRILLKNQSAGAENGIYTVNAAGAPTRATDADTAAEMTAGFAVFVEEGTANADSGWLLTTDGAIVVGTTALVFTQFTGLGQITAGAALTKTGNTLDVATDTTTIEVSADALRIAASAAGAGLSGGGAVALAVNVDGTTIEISTDILRVAATAAGAGLSGGGAVALAVGAGTGMIANANDVAIDTAVVTRKFSATIGDASTTAIIVTHNLGTRDVVCSVHDATTFDEVLVDTQKTTINTVTFTFAVAPASNAYRATIHG